MTLYVLCAQTALDLLLNGTGRMDIAEYINRPSLCSLPRGYSCPKTFDEISGVLEPLCVRFPAHLMMEKSSGQRKDMEFAGHLLPVNAPPASFIRLSGKVYITCPELTLLQVAGDYDIQDLVVLINEMCGAYYADTNDPSFQKPRVPVTTLKKISDYISMASPIRGSAKVTRALKYATENANSYMESRIAAIMRLPFSLGGYNLPPFRMNPEIKLSQAYSNTLRCDKLRPDIEWNPPKLIVEYDSALSHNSSSQMSFDKLRVNAFRDLGYEVRTLVPENFKSHNNIDRALIELRGLLGIKKRMGLLDKNKDLRWSIQDRYFFYGHSAKS